MSPSEGPITDPASRSGPGSAGGAYPFKPNRQMPGMCHALQHSTHLPVRHDFPPEPLQGCF